MKSLLEINITSELELPVVAKTLLQTAGKTSVFLFYAEMGAGKTTLIKELCKSLGSEDNFSSPTYSIVNEYQYTGGKIFHFDLYRLKNTEELLDLGIDDYLQSGNYCFFEWPELLEDLLAEDYLKVEIKVNENIRYLRASQF